MTAGRQLPGRRLPNGVIQHTFTEEDRAKSLAVRRERLELKKKNALELQTAWVREQGDILMSAHARAIERGDWRAAESILNRVLGMPTQRVEKDERILVADLAKLDEATLQAMIRDTEERIARRRTITPTPELDAPEHDDIELSEPPAD